MPEARLARTRSSLPADYQFGDASAAARFDAALTANIASHRFAFTPQGIADCVDDAASQAAYGAWEP